MLARAPNKHTVKHILKHPLEINESQCTSSSAIAYYQLHVQCARIFITPAKKILKDLIIFHSI